MVCCLILLLLLFSGFIDLFFSLLGVCVSFAYLFVILRL